MNILICDDDKLYIDMIRKYVDEFLCITIHNEN